MATREHNIRDVAEALDAKLTALDRVRVELEQRISDGIAVDENRMTLAKVNETLSCGRNARKMMADCCCNVYVCNFEVR